MKISGIFEPNRPSLYKGRSEENRLWQKTVRWLEMQWLDVNKIITLSWKERASIKRLSFFQGNQIKHSLRRLWKLLKEGRDGDFYSSQARRPTTVFQGRNKDNSFDYRCISLPLSQSSSEYLLNLYRSFYFLIPLFNPTVDTELGLQRLRLSLVDFRA